MKSLLAYTNLLQEPVNIEQKIQKLESDEFCEDLLCSDFIFVLVKHTYNNTEPIVAGFIDESAKLNADTL